MKIKLLGAAFAAVALLAFAGAAAATGSTVAVRPGALNGWQIIPDGTVTYGFDATQASIGAGSLHFGPLGAPAVNKFIMAAPYTGLVSDLTGFSYDFWVDTTSGGTTQYKQFYVNVYVDSAANGLGTLATFYDCRYDLVPASGTYGAWHTLSFTQSSTWTAIGNALGSCPGTLGGLPTGSKVLVIVLNGGDSSLSDVNVSGRFDNVVIDTAAGATTYDFEPGLMSIKAGVFGEITGAATGADKKDAGKLNEAAKKLGESLDGSLWEDESHLQAKHGNKVFDKEKEAVNKLEELQKDKKSNLDDGVLQGWIDTLIGADQALAQTAIDDATVACGDAKKLDEAQKEMDKATDELAKGKYHEAIDHYKNAWKKAQEALEKTSGCPA